MFRSKKHSRASMELEATSRILRAFNTRLGKVEPDWKVKGEALHILREVNKGTAVPWQQEIYDRAMDMVPVASQVATTSGIEAAFKLMDESAEYLAKLAAPDEWLAERAVEVDRDPT